MEKEKSNNLPKDIQLMSIRGIIWTQRWGGDGTSDSWYLWDGTSWYLWVGTSFSLCLRSLFWLNCMPINRWVMLKINQRHLFPLLPSNITVHSLWGVWPLSVDCWGGGQMLGFCLPLLWMSHRELCIIHELQVWRNFPVQFLLSGSTNPRLK